MINDVGPTPHTQNSKWYICLYNPSTHTYSPTTHTPHQPHTPTHTPLHTLTPPLHPTPPTNPTPLPHTIHTYLLPHHQPHTPTTHTYPPPPTTPHTPTPSLTSHPYPPPHRSSLSGVLSVAYGLVLVVSAFVLTTAAYIGRQPSMASVFPAAEVIAS